MLNIPSWLSAKFKKDNFSCPKCHKDLEERYVSIIGVKADDSSPSKARLFVQYDCPHCQNSVGFSIADMDLEELSISILQDIAEQNGGNPMSKYSNNPKPTDNPNSHGHKPMPKSKISAEELRLAIEKLNTIETWEEMLAFVGVVDTGNKKQFKIEGNDSV